MGLAMIEPEEGVAMLMRLLTANRHAVVAALPLVRSRLPATLPPFFALLRADKPAAAADRAAGDRCSSRPAAAPACEPASRSGAQCCTTSWPRRW